MSLYDTMTLSKSTRDIILENINNFLDGKISNIDEIISESVGDSEFNSYLPLIETAKAVKELDELESDVSNLVIIDEKDAQKKGKFLSNLLDKINKTYKWFLSQNPEDKLAVLRTFLRIIISITIKILLFISTKKITIKGNSAIAGGVNPKYLPFFKRMAVKLTQTGLAIAVDSIINAIKAYTDKFTLLPLEAKANIEHITDDNLNKLREKRDIFFDKSFDNINEGFKKEAEYKALLLTYDRSIQKLEKIKKYLQRQDNKERKKAVKTIKKIKKDRGVSDD